jgi:hypothetical protein
VTFAPHCQRLVWATLHEKRRRRRLNLSDNDCIFSFDGVHLYRGTIIFKKEVNEKPTTNFNYQLQALYC